MSGSGISWAIMQVCTSLQTDNHTSTPPLSFFTGRMPFLPPNQQCQSTEGPKYISKSTVKAQIAKTCSILGNRQTLLPVLKLWYSGTHTRQTNSQKRQLQLAMKWMKILRWRRCKCATAENSHIHNSNSSSSTVTRSPDLLLQMQTSDTQEYKVAHCQMQSGITVGKYRRCHLTSYSQ